MLPTGTGSPGGDLRAPPSCCARPCPLSWHPIGCARDRLWNAGAILQFGVYRSSHTVFEQPAHIQRPSPMRQPVVLAQPGRRTPPVTAASAGSRDGRRLSGTTLGPGRTTRDSACRRSECPSKDVTRTRVIWIDLLGRPRALQQSPDAGLLAGYSLTRQPSRRHADDAPGQHLTAPAPTPGTARRRWPAHPSGPTGLSSAEATAAFARRLGIDTFQLMVATPLPGTRLWERVAGDRLLVTDDWSLYDGHHVVMRPAQMSPLKLQLGVLRAMRRFTLGRPSSARASSGA